MDTFPIWVKLDYTDMDDLERTDVDKNYSIQDVPWVQFFKGSYGFHAAFWHDDFGRRRSHCCINLSPADARYLFQFTQPALPPGWNAILPIAQCLQRSDRGWRQLKGSTKVARAAPRAHRNVPIGRPFDGAALRGPFSRRSGASFSARRDV